MQTNRDLYDYLRISGKTDKQNGNELADEEKNWKKTDFPDSRENDGSST